LLLRTPSKVVKSTDSSSNRFSSSSISSVVMRLPLTSILCFSSSGECNWKKLDSSSSGT